VSPRAKELSHSQASLICGLSCCSRSTRNRHRRNLQRNTIRRTVPGNHSKNQRILPCAHAYQGGNIHEDMMPASAGREVPDTPTNNQRILDGHARRRTLSTRRRVTAGPDGGALVYSFLSKKRPSPRGVRAWCHGCWMRSLSGEICCDLCGLRS